MNTTDKKIFIIAGESSGDIYGAKLATEAKRIAKTKNYNLKVSGMGGEKMAQAGIDILVDSTELGVMGIIEIFKLLFTFLKVYKKLVNAAKTERPDAVVLIDYAGFNLLYAKALKKANIPVIWYISPKVWVWAKWRKRPLEKLCTKMLVIFPFELDVYNQKELDVEFVGHPMLEIIEEKKEVDTKRDENLFVLLPGSRKSEVTRLLVPMLDVACELIKKHPNLKFVIPAQREKMEILCHEILDKYQKKHPDMPKVEISCGTTYHYQQKAATGLAASGTVTIEAALLKLPLVVIYKMNLITILLASVFVKLYRGFFTLVNIILDKKVFEEFIQLQVNNKFLVPAVEKILIGGERRAEVEFEMDELYRELSAKERPSETAANAILDLINQ